MYRLKELFAQRFKEYKAYEETVSYIESKKAQEAYYMYYMYVNLPLADFFETDKEVLFDYALAGANLRKTRCKDMDEQLFLQYVLCPRVNNEEISSCRTFFASKLLDTLSDNEAENVIKINYYCESEVTYSSTDDRTASAITIYKSGFGRCGEESTFAVSVLRSCGIPARQVYAPLWAHCDDNHAWVEVFVDNAWHYLGACEAGEILDNGWFNDAAARAVLVRSKEFAYSEEFLYEKDGILNNFDSTYEINQTRRYAETKKAELNIKYNGEAVEEGLRAEILLPNYAGFDKLVTLYTKERGKLELELGKGDIMLSFRYKDKLRYIPFDLSLIQNGCTEIDLHEYEPEKEIMHELMWKAPLPSERNRKKAPERKENRYKRKEFPNSDCLEYIKYVGREDIWDILGEKDRRDISPECIKDIEDTVNKFGFPVDIYNKYILNPRVGIEVLKPCRKFLASKFDNIEEIRDFIKDIKQLNFDGIISAVSVYENKAANKISLNTFIVNALRSVNIPAKLENEEVYFMKANENEYLFLPFRDMDLSKLLIKEDINEYLKSFTIAKEADSLYKILENSSISESMQLGLGNYLLTSSIRLPNGNQALAYKFFEMEKDSFKIIKPEYMKFNLKDTLADIKLIDKIKENLYEGKNYSDVNLEDRFSLIIWLEENAEPSKHIINELLSSKECRGMKKLLLFSEKFENKDLSIKKLVEDAKNDISIKDKLGAELCEEFGRSLFVNHENLPIAAFLENDIVRYATSGYQVGTVALIEKLMNVLKDGDINE